MIAELSKAKAAMRSEVRARLQQLSLPARTAASEQIYARVQERDIWRRARSVLFFAPLADEPEIWPLMVDALATGKQVALPRFDLQKKNYVACQIRNLTDDLSPGQFGIREPNNSCSILPLNRLD